jgi:RNA polymerase sigma-70 factor (ECF subfamily)
VIASDALRHIPVAGSMVFRELYDENFDFVWRSLRRLGVSEADAPDAAQEVFVAVHSKLDEFEGRSKLTTWLFGFCLRVASHRRRRASSKHEVLVDGDDDHIDRFADDAPNAEQQAERRRQLALVERILDTLVEEQRVVFILFEFEGMSGDEIAAMLDVPKGTVHSRLRLAREGFRAALARLEARDRRMGVEP